MDFPITPGEVFLLFVFLLTLLFGTIWTMVNFYNYFPLVQTRIEAAWGWLRGEQPIADEGWMFVSEARDWWFLAGSEYMYRYPEIDILVPAYREGEVIEQAIRSVREAAYPDALLEIHVLTEPGDEETRSAVARLSDRYDVNLLTVPAEYPGDPNKPRALNYGFERTEGDVVGIIDAEDIVSPGIFREAAGALLRGADYVLCHLDMTNEDDGWLNLMFRAEYEYWYGDVIPAFATVGYPIPLGGTSCFFRRSVLEDLSAVRYARYGDPWDAEERFWLFTHGLEGSVPWDPRNVTEDFELGLLHWLEDYEFEYLEAVTREESPIGLDGWLRQRTRWKTGKLYTFRHYLQHPPETWRQRFHVYWQSMLPHLGPINIAGLVFVFWLANLAGSVPDRLVAAVLGLGLTFVFVVTFLYARGYWRVSEKPLRIRLRRTVIVALTLVFYWGLQWLADVQALLRMYRRQFDWEKTIHAGRNSTETGPEVVAEEASRHTFGTEVVVDRVDETIDYATTGALKIKRQLPARATAALFLGVLTVGIGLRLYGLTTWSLWIDEVYTITFRSRLPIRDLLVVPYDPHPPLYFLAMRVWLTTFGEAQAAAALFSVLFSAGTIVVMFGFVRDLYDDVTAVLSAFLLAVSTMHVHFGRNIRMYSFLTFFVLLSWYGYRRLQTDSRLGRLGYILATLVMLYTHIFSLFVLLAQHIHSWITVSDPDRVRRWRHVSLVVAVGYLPWSVVLGEQVFGLITGSGGTAVQWIPEPSPALLRDTFLMYAGFPSYYPILAGSDLTWGVAMIVLLVFALTIPFAVVTYYRSGGDTWFVITNAREASLLGVFFLVPIVVPYVLSHLLVPIYFPRYTIAASLPLYVLVARGVTNVPSRGWKLGFLCVFVVSAGITGATYYGGDSVEDWRGTARVLEQEVSPADELLVIQPFWTQNDLEYYYDGLALETVGLPGSGFVTRADRAQLREIANGKDRIWLLRYQTNRTDRVLATFNRSHQLTFFYRDGLLALYRFERGGLSSVRLEQASVNGRSVVKVCDPEMLRGCVPTPITSPAHVADEGRVRTVNTSENLKDPS